MDYRIERRERKKTSRTEKDKYRFIVNLIQDFFYRPYHVCFRDDNNRKREEEEEEKERESRHHS